MEFSHRGGTRDFSAVFSELHSPVDSDAFGVIRSTRPMCYPGVTAEVYPRAIHLSLGISYTERACTRASDQLRFLTAALAQALPAKREPRVWGRGSWEPASIHALPPPVAASLAAHALRQVSLESLRASTELYGARDFHRLSAVAHARSS